MRVAANHFVTRSATTTISESNRSQPLESLMVMRRRAFLRRNTHLIERRRTPLTNRWPPPILTHVHGVVPATLAFLALGRERSRDDRGPRPRNYFHLGDIQ